MRNALSAVILSLLAGFAALGQQPLTVSNDRIEASASGSHLLFNVTNESTKAISSFVVVVDFLNDRGKVVGQGIHVETAQLSGVGLGEGTVPPGSSAEIQVPFPQTRDGSRTAYRIAVDYVLFADRSSWGPDTLKRSLYVEGVLAGSRGEHARLRRLLNTRGSDAVARDLRR